MVRIPSRDKGPVTNAELKLRPHFVAGADLIDPGTAEAADGLVRLDLGNRYVSEERLRGFGIDHLERHPLGHLFGGADVNGGEGNPTDGPLIADDAFEV